MNNGQPSAVRKIKENGITSGTCNNALGPLSQSMGLSNHKSESEGIFLVTIAALLVAMSAVAIAQTDWFG